MASERECPYANSDMTPCYLRDGEIVAVEIHGQRACVGCERTFEMLDAEHSPSDTEATYTCRMGENAPSRRRKQEMTDTGYEGDTTNPKPARFQLELYEAWPSSGTITCRLMRDGHAVGMIYVKNEEEYLWLKNRIDGTYDPEIEDVRADPERTDGSG